MATKMGECEAIHHVAVLVHELLDPRIFVDARDLISFTLEIQNALAVDNLQVFLSVIYYIPRQRASSLVNFEGALQMPEAVVDYDLSRQCFTLVHQEEILGVTSTAGKTWALMNHSKSSQTIEDPEIPIMEASNIKGAEEDSSWSDLSELYSCERREVLSHDGANIPLTIICSWKLKKDGKNPGLIYGYGAYGEVLDKRWCSDRMSLLDRGWVIAFADVRQVCLVFH
eukprot:Gb_02709 [translate_table: standard]